MNYEVGLLLAGRYRLEDVIATGGMGQVWRAVDETLQRGVAVKVLRPGDTQRDVFLERFRTEARNCAALQHPNIVTIHDFGEGDESAYLVMELIEGQPLSVVLEERGALPPWEARDLLYQVSIALQAAHDGGVIHRDVKPANIVVDSQGYARLTDFGISKATSGSALTQTGELLGTAHYLSPEQLQGHAAGPSSDIYSLAVVGYELVTGARPFNGESVVSTALAHVGQPAPALPESVPEPLRTTVMAGLAKLPESRPESAAAFAAALMLPAGTVPTHLVKGARSAMTPVIGGLGPTGVMPQPADHH
jgi:serine/threonine-protein kinase